MKAVVNQDICIGCQLCEQVCSDIYRMDGDKALVYIDPIPEEYESSCRDAAVQCVVNAISIIEDSNP